MREGFGLSPERPSAQVPPLRQPTGPLRAPRPDRPEVEAFNEEQRRTLELQQRFAERPGSRPFDPALRVGAKALDIISTPTRLIAQQTPSADRPEVTAFEEEQRRILELQQQFAETSPDVVGQRVLDPLGRFQRTGSGAILQAAARTPVVGRIPGLTEFKENVAAEREQGAGRLESLRLAREQAEQQTTQFPSTAIPLSQIPLPFGREISDFPIGMLGAADVLADPTLPLPVIGVGGALGKKAIQASGKEIVRDLTKQAVRRARLASAPQVPRGGVTGPLTAPAREAVREAPEAAVRAVGEGQILPAPAVREAVEVVPEQQALQPPAQPPTPPRGPDFSASALPEQPEDVFARIRQQATPGEKPSETLLRRHEASINTAENEARLITNAGNESLKAKGIGQNIRGRLAPREQDIPELDALYASLHDPVNTPPPARLADDFQQLRGRADWEEAARVEFDPDMVIVPEGEYFYRGWKPPEGLERRAGGPGRATVGVRPGFVNQRVPLTYQQMRQKGFEPLFWNPYEQWRVSRLMGVRHRQQTQLIQDLKELGLAVPDNGGVGLKEWRTPEIGPAFQGKAFVTDTGEVAFSHRWVLPDELANRMENIYGKPPSIGKVHVGGKEIDLLRAIDVATFVPKRAKLFASFFQQQDFLTRSLIGTWTKTVDDLFAGRPDRAVRTLGTWPKTAVTIIQANLGPGARTRIRQTLNSTDAILPDRPGVHFRGVMEGGLSTIDTTLLPENIDQIARLAAQDAGVLGVKKVARLVGDVEAAMRRGLFEGIYPAAQITDIRNNIAPMLAKQFPNATDEALNGMIARITNIKYSTIPASQSVFQNRTIREILRRVFFSIGESEGLLRQATGAIRGPNAAFWRKHWLGAYLAVIATANAIHFASTRKPLPFDRYSPISRDSFGPLPIGYNRDFAAPNIPLTGRNSTDIVLDVVAQMDTAFRLLDPGSFLQSRESVPVRAIANQATGENFFGEDITDVGPGGVVSRTAQLINDVFVPIGAGSVLGAFREDIPGGEVGIPEAESRLGRAGQIVQGGGVNLRSETTAQLLNRDADAYLPGSTYRELESWQRDEVQHRQAAELAARQQTGVGRQQETSELFAKLDQFDVEWQLALDALASNIGKRLGTGPGATEIDQRFVQGRYFDLEAALFNAKRGVNRSFDREFGDREQTPNEADVDTYFALTEQATVDGVFIPKRLTELRIQFMNTLSPERRDYVLRNINRRGRQIPPKILNMLPESTRTRIRASIQARDAARRRLGLPIPQGASISPGRRLLPGQVGSGNFPAPVGGR